MKLKRVLAWVMMGCLLLTMTACGTKSGGAYTIVSTLTEGSYAIGFRNDDTTGDYVLAALKVLAAEGKIDELDVRWFGKEVSHFESDKNALKDMEKPEARTLTARQPSMTFRSKARNTPGCPEAAMAKAVRRLSGPSDSMSARGS